MQVNTGVRIQLENRTADMGASQSASRHYYRPELDVVRFFAFLLVFFDHTVPQASDARVSSVLGGLAPLLYAAARSTGFGLSLFFTLSAFLICELLRRERHLTGTVSAPQFYWRRMLRIWPLYYLALLIGVVIALSPGNHHGEIVQMGWFALFLGDVFRLIPGSATPMGQLWSISIEEQFYFLIPWIGKFFNRIALFGFCIALVVAANAELYHLGSVNAARLRIWTNPFVQFECFAAGIILCLVLSGRLPRLVGWQRLLLLAASFACWLYASSGLHIHFLKGDNNPGSWSLMGGYALGALGSVLLIIAFLGVNADLLPRWTIYLGRISYGLYVFHEISIYIATHIVFGTLTSFAGPLYWLKGILTLGLNVLLAAASYRYFETPFLKMKKRHAVIASQPVGAPLELSASNEPMRGQSIAVEEAPAR